MIQLCEIRIESLEKVSTGLEASTSGGRKWDRIWFVFCRTYGA